MSTLFGELSPKDSKLSPKDSKISPKDKILFPKNRKLSPKDRMTGLPMAGFSLLDILTGVNGDGDARFINFLKNALFALFFFFPF